jgi:anthranilate/para-aminobenzoate synthase component II
MWAKLAPISVEPLRIVVVDNYDSFTFNLVELLERLGARCRVVLHDAATLDELVASPDRTPS